MKVIANCQLRGSYGSMAPDQEFETTEDIGGQLLKNGSVRHAVPPRIQYETKIITPEAPEVGPREPFRDRTVSHQEPETVAAESPELFHGANLPALGTTDPRGRGRRSGSHSGR